MQIESKHASQDELELYVMNSMQEQHSDRIEEHLLCCSLCAESIVQIVDEISFLRLALRQYNASEKRRADGESSRSLLGAFALR
jgi:hypothetical protein